MTIEELEELSESHPIIFYDGICVLCDKSIQFFIKHDHSYQLRFAMLQSDIGKKILQKIGRSTEKIDTTILVHKRSYFIASDVGIIASQYLSNPYKLFYNFRIIPKFIRDFIYWIIAKNRYHWFGKDESCLVPSDEIKKQLIV